MKTPKLLLFFLLMIAISCKDRAVSESADLPILGEVLMDPDTGEAIHYRAPEFQLTSQLGHSYSSKDVTGKIHVVDFFFTSCPTICPQMTSHFKEVQEHFKGDSRVKLLSYSIDGENDSPDVLSHYANSYEIDGDQWKLLTGIPEDIFEISRGYKVMAYNNSFRGEYNLVHDGTFVLLDTERRIRGYYNGLDMKDTERLIDDMEKLLNTL